MLDHHQGVGSCHFFQSLEKQLLICNWQDYAVNQALDRCSDFAVQGWQINLLVHVVGVIFIDLR
jgi:hypothetical protein